MDPEVHSNEILPTLLPPPNSNLSMEELIKFELAQEEFRSPLPVAIPMTLIYSLILISGLLGNVATCIVIARTNYMHTATNYYLFSLAMSDLLLLVSGLPQEIYLIWVKKPYMFGQLFCVIRGLAAETSANATVLTITAFTVERFVAIVYPLKSHKLSQLSRVVRMIGIIWVVALCLALPQAAQFGLLDEMSKYDPSVVLIEGAWCAIVREIFPYAFQISIFVFFVIPMTTITVLYIMIGVQLRRSRNGVGNEPRLNPRHSQTRVIRMLVCVVVAFFISWAPFHAQRLLALYLESQEHPPEFWIEVYEGLNHISGVLYFTGTCINPILYHIMSNKFRQAFKETITRFCITRRHHRSLHASHNSSVYHNHNNARVLGKANSIPMAKTFNIVNYECPCKENRIGETEFYPRGVVAPEGRKADCVVCKEKVGSNKGNFRFLNKTNELNTPPEIGTPSKSCCDLQASSVAVINPSHPTPNISANNGSIPSSKILKPFIPLRSKRKQKHPKAAMKFQAHHCHHEVNKLNYHHPLINEAERKEKAFLRKIASNCSMDSARTNTISNSSLQDLDEAEYTSEELAGYMGEINMNLESPNNYSEYHCESQSIPTTGNE